MRQGARERLLGVAGGGGAPDREHVVERAEEEVEQLGVELRAAPFSIISRASSIENAGR